MLRPGSGCTNGANTGFSANRAPLRRSKTKVCLRFLEATGNREQNILVKLMRFAKARVDVALPSILAEHSPWTGEVLCAQRDRQPEKHHVIGKIDCIEQRRHRA